MSKTVEECKKEAMARIKRLRGTSADEDIAKALNRIAAALERLGDAYLYVNQQEDEPSFEGQSLSDREHL